MVDIIFNLSVVSFLTTTESSSKLRLSSSNSSSFLDILFWKIFSISVVLVENFCLSLSNSLFKWKIFSSNCSIFPNSSPSPILSQIYSIFVTTFSTSLTTSTISGGLFSNCCIFNNSSFTWVSSVTLTILSTIFSTGTSTRISRITSISTRFSPIPSVFKSFSPSLSVSPKKPNFLMSNPCLKQRYMKSSLSSILFASQNADTACIIDLLNILESFCSILNIFK